MQSFLDALQRGAPLESYLQRAGDPDPAAAARAFARAAQDVGLAAQLERWAAPLLTSARPGFGAQCLEELAAEHRERAGASLDLASHPQLPRLLGSSNFLARMLLRHPHWVDEELRGDPVPPPPRDACGTAAADWETIRIRKYRGLLRIAARDLAGRSFVASLDELSGLADACLEAAWARAQVEAEIDGPVLFALGKLGGRELNFASDVDLLFVYEPPADCDELAYNGEVARFVRTLKSGLESPGDVGFGYRVDLDLRPEGPTGVLANSVDAALAYYESFGAEWERQALLRLRGVVGPMAARRRFETGLAPFVYRRTIGHDVVQAVHDMKARIETERRAAGRDIESDVKEGPGGIRDVEFLVQALQLLYAGHEPALRTGNVLRALGALQQTGILGAEVCGALGEAYVWLRRAEHALQLADERQTQRIPRDDAGRLSLARRMGYVEEEGRRARERWEADWSAYRISVRGEFEALLRRDAR